VNPGVATALMQMAQCATEHRAASWAAIAMHRGATDEQMFAAWVEWHDLQSQQVQTVGGGRCLCSHAAGQHTDGTGRCAHRACGCTRVRSAR
jgi:hypothetical protein